VTPTKAAAVGFIVERLDRFRYLHRNHADAIGAYREWLDGLEALADAIPLWPAIVSSEAIAGTVRSAVVKLADAAIKWKDEEL
jgi:hypothetical protein